MGALRRSTTLIGTSGLAAEATIEGTDGDDVIEATSSPRTRATTTSLAAPGPTNPNQGGFYILKCGDWLHWSGPTDIDLATGVVRNKAGRGSALGIENVKEDYVRGGVIRGDAGSNTLWGGRVYGRGGDDFLSGRSMDGGDGFDTCSAGPRVRCEVTEVDDAKSWARPQLYVPWRP